MHVYAPRGNESSPPRERLRSAPARFGLCKECSDPCTGACDLFQWSLRGSESVSHAPTTTAAQGEPLVDYSHLSIVAGATDAASAEAAGVNVTTSYGRAHPVAMRMPLLPGSLNTLGDGRVHADAFVAGVAVCGIPLTLDADLLEDDKNAEREGDGRPTASRELDRVAALYRRWRQRYGDIILQTRIDGACRGVAAWAIERLGIETVALKWPSAGDFRGSPAVRSLDQALMQRRQDRTVTPNPGDPAIAAAFRSGVVREFLCHSPGGFLDEQTLARTVEAVRQAGAKRVLLKVRASSSQDLAAAIRWATNAAVDMLVVAPLDDAPGGMGQGIPAFFVHCLARQFAARLAARSLETPALALAGSFSTEEHVFKALALGTPHVRAVCMGSALRVPVLIGDNIEGVLRSNRITPWHELPPGVRRHGDCPEQIFATFESLARRYGRETMDEMPLGAVAMHAFVDKLRVGMCRYMAAARHFRLGSVNRTDLVSLSEEAARVSGIPHVLEAGMEAAERILDA